MFVDKYIAVCSDRATSLCTPYACLSAQNNSTRFLSIQAARTDTQNLPARQLCWQVPEGQDARPEARRASRGYGTLEPNIDSSPQLNAASVT